MIHGKTSKFVGKATVNHDVGVAGRSEIELPNGIAERSEIELPKGIFQFGRLFRCYRRKM